MVLQSAMALGARAGRPLLLAGCALASCSVAQASTGCLASEPGLVSPQAQPCSESDPTLILSLPSSPASDTREL